MIVNNSSNIKKTNNYLSPPPTEHKIKNTTYYVGKFLNFIFFQKNKFIVNFTVDNYYLLNRFVSKIAISGVDDDNRIYIAVD